ncbi:coiled-coil domain-containing protein 87-like isoform X2 [Branchiostoma floridae]|uniref:Coiled-coil domain-containing protein 87-like isoform X2 n=1 Tax=Branchiostoma floridae TaxID=7739 RepID=A0A9J7MGP6_BRAFL|nr:coiled-coil domain-containing protein 87-like isoform X2 [Branchiostoma floridae]
MSARSLEKLGIPSLPQPKLRKKRGMYSMDKDTINKEEIEQQVTDIKVPLTLFAPFHHEDEPQTEDLEIERPVTPIDESIKAPPATFGVLAKLVRRRICVRTDMRHISTEDQQSLGGIIMGELNSIWPDIRRQVDDPFLSAEQNKELQRRITVHIVTVCEQLFLHYLQKAEVLNRRGIFSGPANMSRLRTQLGIDANKYLNILAIRRYIVGDMRKKPGDAEADVSDSGYEYSSRAPTTTVSPSMLERKKKKLGLQPLSYQQMLELSRPQSRRKVKTNTEREIRDMYNQMPVIDTEVLEDLIPRPPSEYEEGYEIPDVMSVHSRSQMTLASDRSSQMDIGKRLATTDDIFRLQKSQSMPELDPGENLLEELSIQLNDKGTSVTIDFQQERRAATPDEPLVSRPDARKPTKEDEERKKLDSRQYLADDLQKLVASRAPQEPVEGDQDEEDLPPLLQATTTGEESEEKQQALQARLQELEEKEARQREEENIPLAQPTHPQPAVVSTKISKKMVVRTSDVRVSERVSLSSLTIQRSATLYNDLLGHITPSDIKHLDRNLFLHKEINDVYQEIMRTVPSDHVLFDQDDIVEKHSTNVDVSKAVASSTLSKRKKDRIINPSLQVGKKAPWGEGEMRDWSKSAVFAQKVVLWGKEQQRIKQKKINRRKRIVRRALQRGRLLAKVKLAMGGKKSFGKPQNLVKFLGKPQDLTKTLGKPWDLTKSLEQPQDQTKSLEQPQDLAKSLGKPQDLEVARQSFRQSSDAGPVIQAPGTAAKPGPVMDKDMETIFASLPPSQHTSDQKSSRAYASWLAWWKSTINTDDYLKYLSTQESDFMGVVFHFYDSEESEDEEETEQGKRLTSKRQQQALEKEQKIEELRQKKSEFVSGMWNVNSVLLGGLGRDPLVEDDEGYPSSLEETPRADRLQASPSGLSPGRSSSHLTSARSPSSLGVPSQKGSGSRTTTAGTSKKSGEGEDKEPEKPVELTAQERLEKVWSDLQMPDGQKLDMAIKYSSDAYIVKLPESIKAWEKATCLILQREAALSHLERFERQASDPNRFFERGYRGSSVARMEESKQRTELLRRLDVLDKKAGDAVKKVATNFQDSISFQGRPYMDKMKWDRTEMLYWLQQERREQALEIGMMTQVPVKVAELAPIQLSRPVL